MALFSDIECIRKERSFGAGGGHECSFEHIEYGAFCSLRGERSNKQLDIELSSSKEMSGL